MQPLPIPTNQSSPPAPPKRVGSGWFDLSGTPVLRLTFSSPPALAYTCTHRYETASSALAGVSEWKKHNEQLETGSGGGSFKEADPYPARGAPSGGAPPAPPIPPAPGPPPVPPPDFNNSQASTLTERPSLVDAIASAKLTPGSSRKIPPPAAAKPAPGLSMQEEMAAKLQRRAEMSKADEEPKKKAPPRVASKRGSATAAKYGDC